MVDWSETNRGSIRAWECDIVEDFTVAYYFERLATSPTGWACGRSHGSRKVSRSEPGRCGSCGAGSRHELSCCPALPRPTNQGAAQRFPLASTGTQERACSSSPRSACQGHTCTRTGGASFLTLALQMRRIAGVKWSDRIDDRTYLGNTSLRYIPSQERCGRCKIASLVQAGEQRDLDAQCPTVLPPALGEAVIRLLAHCRRVENGRKP